jgi:hypothetical protein
MPGNASAAAKSALAAGAGARFVSRLRAAASRWLKSGARTTAAIARGRGVRSRRAPGSSVAATPASADAVSAGRGFLARVNVILDLQFQAVGVDLHRGFREIAALPGLRWLQRRAAAGGDRRKQDQRT